MTHRLQTPDGKKLFALRKHTAEPVFGIIKPVLGFRQFLLRGIEGGRGEWSLLRPSSGRHHPRRADSSTTDRTNALVACQFALDSDPHFASNSDSVVMV